MANHNGDAMGTRKKTGIVRMGRLGIWPCLLGTLLLAGCSSSAGSDVGSGEGRLICSKCVGGETSDFGTAIAAPTACEQSESSQIIDEATARALGFGDALDQYARSLSTPFAWTANELPAGGQPAQGYSPATSLT